MDRISDPRDDPSKVPPHDSETNMEPTEKFGTDVARGDLIELDSADAVLAAKMHLLNEAINEIGWTTYHLKLFFLNGFGFAVDSLLTFIIGVVKGQVALEMQPSYNGGAQMALYVGLLFGALFWGLSADMIGRKWAFNLSLLTAAIFSIAAGASPNYPALATFVALAAFGAGGNLVLDTTVFLEFLPSSKQYLVVTMALWWGIGQTIAGLLAWAFITNFSCTSADNCPMADNMGWRYLYYTSGAFVLVLSILRIVVLRFRETPKYLLCSGQDEAVISLLTDVATKYNRPCSLTIEQLQYCGSITTAHASSRYSLYEVLLHYRGLFATRKLSISTSLLWASWACIGLAYPLYYMFLPEYLASRGAKFGEDSPHITWRNYALTNFAAIFGPIFAGYISSFKIIGRKYTMVIGAMMTMVFFFGYTGIKNNDQNLGLNCATSFTINVYFSVLYAYTPEVLPSAHRATGNGTAVSCARVGGIMAVVIGTFADTSSPEPIYICAALFIVMAILIGVAPIQQVKDAGLTCISLTIGFWYEHSVALRDGGFGIDITKKSIVLFDDGNKAVNASTWPQCGRALAALASLKRLPEDENDKSVTLANFHDRPAFVSSFRVSQNDILKSIQRVTGTSDGGWHVSRQASSDRFAEDARDLQEGNPVGFYKQMYARVFYPVGDADFETDNALLWLSDEELDEATRAGIKLAEAGYSY